jgi:hypothetical protein
MHRSWTEYACLGCLVVGIAIGFAIDGFDYHPVWVRVLGLVSIIFAAVLAPIGAIVRARGRSAPGDRV